MRSISIAVALAVGLLAPITAVAADVDEELKAMKGRIAKLESELQESRTELARQDVEEADTSRTSAEPSFLLGEPAPEDRSIVSKLSSFLEATEFSGWVAASYAYNFNAGNGDLAKGLNTGGGGVGPGMDYRLHPDHNTFAVDQVWFEIDKPVSEDSRAGFHIDFLFGRNAENLGAGWGMGEIVSSAAFTDPNTGQDVSVADLEIITSPNDSGDSTKLHTAYGSYLAPIGPGIQVDFGKLPSLLGYEVVQAPYNFNITRGILFTMQPISNVGVVFSSEVLPGLSLAAGVLNSVFSDTSVDLDSNKAVTAQVKWERELFSLTGSMIWGSPQGGGENDEAGVGDFVATWDPLESLSLWLNADIAWFNGEGIELDGYNYGVALAGRYGINDRWGVALRGEWARFDPSSSNFAGIPPAQISGTSVQDFFSVTATSDFAITNRLQLRGEVRFDITDSDFEVLGIEARDYYKTGSGNFKDNQTVVLMELIYAF